jgi:hypothetical protein
MEGTLHMTDERFAEDHPEELMDARDALENPENYLWVTYGDHLTVITQQRLRMLQAGATPKNDVERMLVDNPMWLEIYLAYAIGCWLVTINVGKPLPEWDDAVWDQVNGLYEEPSKPLTFRH